MNLKSQDSLLSLNKRNSPLHPSAGYPSRVFPRASIQTEKQDSGFWATGWKVPSSSWERPAEGFGSQGGNRRVGAVSYLVRCWPCGWEGSGLEQAEVPPLWSPQCPVRCQPQDLVLSLMLSGSLYGGGRMTRAHSQRLTAGASGSQTACFFPGETESVSPGLSSSSHLPTWVVSQNLTQRDAPESLPEEAKAQSREVWCSRKNGKV